MMKQGTGKKQKVTKGTPSAVVLSIVIHAALFLLAGTLVVFTVVKKEEKKFEPPKAVERPKMKLRKPKVKPQKSSKPKSTTRIVTRKNVARMPDIQLPEMSGMGDGLGDGVIGGFDMMPDLGEISVFGGGQSIGNDFEGQLYDLKRDSNGRKCSISEDAFKMAVRKFILSGWDRRALAKYYRSAKKLYTYHFMIPPIPTVMAPDHFGEPDTQSFFFLIVYKGKLVSPEPITFRFRGGGDAFLMVQVDGRNVLLACNATGTGVWDWWESSSPKSYGYSSAGVTTVVGDWITLEPNKPVDMEVMFGENKWGVVAAVLTVEVKGKEYETTFRGAPILPAFKTSELTRDDIEEINKYLPANEVSLTNGPIFRDYGYSGDEATPEPDTVEAPPIAEAMPKEYDITKTRSWTLNDGSCLDAKFATIMAGQVVLRDIRGRTLKIPKNRFSANDLMAIELAVPPNLGISFSKQSTKRVYPIGWPNSDPAPRQFIYIFSTDVEQTSPRQYDHELDVEIFAIGAEIGGDNYVLLDHQEHSGVLNEENHQSMRFSGETVTVDDYWLGNPRDGFQHRGVKYSSYLIVIKDLRGEIIAYETPKKWLFEKYDKLKQIPVGKYFDKTCTRVSPTPPRSIQ